jgi:hypothetical protein
LSVSRCDDVRHRTARACPGSEAAECLGGGSGECRAGRRPAAVFWAAVIGLGPSCPLRVAFLFISHDLAIKLTSIESL